MRPSRLPLVCTCAALLLAAGAAHAQGTPFVEPPVRTSEHGVLRDTLRAQVSVHQVGGRRLETATYGGLLPGKTWRVRRGDTLRVLLENRLAFPGQPAPDVRLVDCGSPRMVHAHLASMENAVASVDTALQLATNLHTHGLQVSPVGNADNPLIDLRPGEACEYVIPIPTDQPAGFDWYHPHRHGATAKQTWAGMAGGIVVEGPLDSVPEIAAAVDRVMVLQELWVNDSGRVPTGIPLPVVGMVPFTTVGAVPTDFLFTVNGVVQPAIPARPGQVQRWRLVNAAPHHFFLLRLDGHAFFQIAQDGIALRRVRPVQEILLAPGNRVEVLVKAGAPGTYRFRAASYDQGHPGGPMPEVQLGSLEVRGAPMEMSLPRDSLPTVPPPGPPTNFRRITFQGQILTAPVSFSLDSVVFDPRKPAQRVSVGTVEDWTLVNQDVFQHPFHIHVNPFQVIEINGAPVAEPIWWDTFVLPAHGTVRVRMFFRPDVTGVTVYHCHILPHEDNGMIATFELVPAAPAGSHGAGARPAGGTP
jgi:FtsP/CotA-like multicopper oxidase with cupredoxin domain